MCRVVGLLLVVVLAASCGGGIGEGGVVLRVPAGTDLELLFQAIEIMKRRIETLDKRDRTGNHHHRRKDVAVKLQGVTDSERVVSMITSPGQLSFRPVLEASMLISPLLDPDQSGGTSQLPAGIDPSTGLTVSDDQTREAWLAEYAVDGSVVWVYHVGPSQLSGADLADAPAGFAGGPTADGMGVRECLG